MNESTNEGGGGTVVRDDPADGTQLTVEEVCDVLGPERRRIGLRLTNDLEGEISLNELADRVADAEAEVRNGDVSRADVRSSLYLVHLPRLAEVGVVAFDPVRKTIRQQPRAD